MTAAAEPAGRRPDGRPGGLLAAVAAFEFRGQMRSPLFWSLTGIFFLLVFGFMASDHIHIGDTDNVHKNGPFSIGQTHLIMALFYMFAATAVVAGAVTKDDETGFGPIIRAAPLAKSDYLFGRFAGAFAAVALSFFAVTAAMIVGSFLPWLDPEQVGPLRLDAYAFAYFILALPVLFFTSALFFAMAAISRSMAWTFVAVIAVIVLYVVASIALGKPDLEVLAARWDPFGLFAFDTATRYWTAQDRNTLLPPLVGPLLFNRVFCLSLGAACLFAAQLFTRWRDVAGRAARVSEAAEAPAAISFAAPAAALPGVAARPVFDRRTALAQFVARTRFDMGQVLKSPVFWIVLGLGLANAAGALWSVTDDDRYGGALWPVTRLLIPVLDGSFNIFAIIIAAWYAGELVWRDRDRGAHEMIDATPAPDWTFLIPKTAAVALVLIAAVGMSILAAILVQIAKGWFRFEPGEYLLWYLVPQAADLIVLASLAIFFQAISPGKFVGWGLMVLYIVALFALPGLGVQHNLVIFGRHNPVPLSDMNGQGRYWIGAWWFRLYWSAVALLLLVAAYALWRRGTEMRMAPRLARAPGRLKGPAGVLALAALAVFAASGVFIYVNTNIWNPYRTDLNDDRWLADYEKTLLRYAGLPQPTVVAVQLQVDLRPHRPVMETVGRYVLENKTNQPLREVHVRFDRDLDVRALSVEGAWAKQTFDRFNYRIFAFDTPMAPGERRVLAFDTLITERGFRNSQRKTRDLTNVVDNGTFVDSFAFTPVIGMTRDDLLTDRAKRRKYGLPAELDPPPLGDVASRAFSYVGHAGWSSADITLTTDADQIPVAPGRKIFDEVRGGRRTARFVADAPILQFFSVQSARYAVRGQRYKGVDLQVFYDARHAMNVDRMLRALRASLDYYQANFGPYQFHQTRIVEFPDYAQFAQSFAGTFPWSEGLGFIADCRDPTRIDLVSYVAAHEFAHQWWAHQVVGADQEGATALSETLAQYSALRVMRRLYGPDQIRKFLKYELDSYLRNRGAEVAAEEPLERVHQDQGYIHYRKGSLVMARLADEIGEDAVNRALRTLLARYAFKGAPYPTALDLVAALRAQAPADKQQLITDLFEKITLYEVKAQAAHATRRPDGLWDVALTVDAKKLYADGRGRETAAAMNETLDVGLFSRKPDAAGFGPRDVLAFEKAPIRSGVQTLHLTARARPAFAGADPYATLIDRNTDAHLTAVN